MCICGGAILEPQKNYTYSGKICECAYPQPHHLGPGIRQRSTTTAYDKKATKPRPLIVPVEATEEEIKAFEDGAAKYGYGQWETSEEVTAEKIMNALERHWLAYKKGELRAPDSNIEHLAHIRANCAILMKRFDKERAGR